MLDDKDVREGTTGGSENRDPITGAPGAHPVGTGVGAAGGAAAGAAIGSVAGPAGTLVGGAIGAVAGGLVGKGVAEGIDPTVEDAYWRDNHSTRPYYEKDYNYDNDYAPAYRYGWESRSRYQGRKFDEVDNDLSRDWETNKGSSRLDWDRAKLATRDAWHRVEERIPGDADNDGR
jgi:hypothetical protein